MAYQTANDIAEQFIGIENQSDQNGLWVILKDCATSQMFPMKHLRTTKTHYGDQMIFESHYTHLNSDSERLYVNRIYHNSVYIRNIYAEFRSQRVFNIELLYGQWKYARKPQSNRYRLGNKCI